MVKEGKGTCIVFPPMEWPMPTNRRRDGRRGRYSSCSGTGTPTSGKQCCTRERISLAYSGISTPLSV